MEQKSHLRRKMQLLNMESLMQSEFGHSYQIALGSKALYIDRLHT